VAETIEIIITAKDRASGPLRDAKGEVEGLDKRAHRAGGSGGGLAKLGGALAGIGKAAFALGGLALASGGALAGIGIAANASMEQTEVAFGTLLGSGEKAAEFLNELRDFAAATPFEFPELADSAKKLLAMGFAADQIIPMMTTIGDTVGALGGGQAEIDRVTMALGQMQAKGKVSAEEMMQLAELGIPAWKILADQLGVTTAEAMKLAENGLIPADIAIQALRDGMDASFGGSMAAQAQTFNGLMSTLKDNAMLALQAFTGPLFDAAKEALTELGTAVSSPAFQEFAETMGARVGEAIGQFAGWLRSDGIPAAMEFAGFIQTNVIPALTDAYNWLSTNLPPAIQTLSEFWTNTLQPAIQTVSEYITTTVIPAITDVYTWIQTNLPPAIQTLSEFWTNTLQPAIQTVSEYITTTVIPAITDVYTWIQTNLPPAIQALADFWSNTLLPAITAIADFIQDPLVPLWNEITGLISDIIGPTDEFTDALGDLASWLLGQVKTGLETLWGLMDDIAGPFRTAAQVVGDWKGALKTATDAANGIISALRTMRDLINNMPKLPGIGTNATTMAGFAAGVGASLVGRAAGGPVAGGSPYLVGERGPELFVPRASGMIVPNHAIAPVSVGNITVNAAPGMNERRLAQLVREEITMMAASGATRGRI
jgi:tape measure domain-containing protein